MRKFNKIMTIVTLAIIIISSIFLIKEASAYSTRQIRPDVQEVYVYGNLNDFSNNYGFIFQLKERENGFSFVTSNNWKTAYPRSEQLGQEIRELEEDYTREQDSQGMNRFVLYLLIVFDRSDFMSKLASLQIGQPVTCEWRYRATTSSYLLECTPN